MSKSTFLVSFTWSSRHFIALTTMALSIASTSLGSGIRLSTCLSLTIHHLTNSLLLRNRNCVFCQPTMSAKISVEGNKGIPKLHGLKRPGPSTTGLWGICRASAEHPSPSLHGTRLFVQWSVCLYFGTLIVQYNSLFVSTGKGWVDWKLDSMPRSGRFRFSRHQRLFLLLSSFIWKTWWFGIASWTFTLQKVHFAESKLAMAHLPETAHFIKHSQSVFTELLTSKLLMWPETILGSIFMWTIGIPAKLQFWTVLIWLKCSNSSIGSKLGFLGSWEKHTASLENHSKQSDFNGRPIACSGRRSQTGRKVTSKTAGSSDLGIVSVSGSTSSPTEMTWRDRLDLALDELLLLSSSYDAPTPPDANMVDTDADNEAEVAWPFIDSIAVCVSRTICKPQTKEKFRVAHWMILASLRHFSYQIFTAFAEFVLLFHHPFSQFFAQCFFFNSSEKQAMTRFVPPACFWRGRGHIWQQYLSPSAAKSWFSLHGWGANDLPDFSSGGIGSACLICPQQPRWWRGTKVAALFVPFVCKEVFCLLQFWVWGKKRVQILSFCCITFWWISVGGGGAQVAARFSPESCEKVLRNFIFGAGGGGSCVAVRFVPLSCPWGNCHKRLPLTWAQVAKTKTKQAYSQWQTRTRRWPWRDTLGIVLQGFWRSYPLPCRKFALLLCSERRGMHLHFHWTSVVHSLLRDTSHDIVPSLPSPFASSVWKVRSVQGTHHRLERWTEHCRFEWPLTSSRSCLQILCFLLLWSARPQLALSGKTLKQMHWQKSLSDDQLSELILMSWIACFCHHDDLTPRWRQRTQNACMTWTCTAWRWAIGVHAFWSGATECKPVQFCQQTGGVSVRRFQCISRHQAEASRNTHQWRSSCLQKNQIFFCIGCWTNNLLQMHQLFLRDRVAWTKVEFQIFWFLRKNASSDALIKPSACQKGKTQNIEIRRLCDGGTELHPDGTCRPCQTGFYKCTPSFQRCNRQRCTSAQFVANILTIASKSKICVPIHSFGPPAMVSG